MSREVKHRAERPSVLRIRAALSIDEPRACVLGYLRELPLVGRPITEMADREEVLVQRAAEVLDALRKLRATAHAEAFRNWTEQEIREAVAKVV